MKFIFKALLLCLFSNAILLSQTPVISINEPIVGSENIGLNPDIKISLNDPFKFVQNSLYLDSLRVDNPYDSLNQEYSMGILHLINSDNYDGSDSTLGLARVSGREAYCSIISDDSLKINTMQQLSYNTNYGLVTRDLKVYNSITQDTIKIDTLINNIFKTTYPIYHVESYSTYNTTIMCNDTIVVDFNRPLTSTSTVQGNIVELQDTSGTTISSTYWLSQDGLKLYAKSDNDLTPGNFYNLKFNISYLTGNSISDFENIFYVKKKSNIFTSAKIKNASEGISMPIGCYPMGKEKMNFLSSQDTIYLKAKKRVDEYRFLYWECPEYPSIHHSSMLSASIVQKAHELKDLNIYAVYDIALKDVLTIRNMNSPEGSISIEEGTYTSLGNNEFSFAKNDEIILFADGNDQNGYYFSHWQCSFPAIDGITNPRLNLSNFLVKNEDIIANIDLEAVYEFHIPDDKAKIRVKAMIDNDDKSICTNFKDISNILSIRYFNEDSQTWEPYQLSGKCGTEGTSLEFNKPVDNKGRLEITLQNPSEYEIVGVFDSEKNKYVKNNEYSYLAVENPQIDLIPFEFTFSDRNLQDVNIIYRKKRVYFLLEEAFPGTLENEDIDSYNDFPHHILSAEVKVNGIAAWEHISNPKMKNFWGIKNENGTSDVHYSMPFLLSGKSKYGDDLTWKKVYRVFKLRIGDNVTITPKILHASDQYHIGDWVEGGSYVHDIVDPSTKTLSFTVDDNVVAPTSNYCRAFHEYSLGFRLEAIGFRVPYKFGFTELDPNLVQTDQGSYFYLPFDSRKNDLDLPDGNDDKAKINRNGSPFIVGMTLQRPSGITYGSSTIRDAIKDIGNVYTTTEFVYVFTEEVDQTTLNGNIYAYDKLNYDPVYNVPKVGKRHDQEEGQKYRLQIGGASGNGSLEKGKVVYHSIWNPDNNVECTHMSEVAFTLTNGIKSTDGEALTVGNNGFTYHVITEEPQLIITAVDYYHGMASSIWSAIYGEDILLHIYSAVGTRDKLSRGPEYNKDDARKFPESQEFYPNVTGTKVLNTEILNVQHMRRADILDIGFESTRDLYGDVHNNTGNIWQGVKNRYFENEEEKILSVLPQSWTVYLWLAEKVLDYAEGCFWYTDDIVYEKIGAKLTSDGNSHISVTEEPLGRYWGADWFYQPKEVIFRYQGSKGQFYQFKLRIYLK